MWPFAKAKTPICYFHTWDVLKTRPISGDEVFICAVKCRVCGYKTIKFDWPDEFPPTKDGE